MVSPSNRQGAIDRYVRRHVEFFRREIPLPKGATMAERNPHRPQGTGARNHAQPAGDRQRRLRRHGGRVDQAPARRRRKLRDRGVARRRRGFLRRPRDHGQTPARPAARGLRAAPPQRRGVQLLRRLPALRDPGDRRGARGAPSASAAPSRRSATSRSPPTAPSFRCRKWRTTSCRPW